jgi:ribosomal-protein-alanine N-acetyltransferase
MRRTYTVRRANPLDITSIASLEREAFGTEEGARRVRTRAGGRGAVEAWVAQADDGAVVAFLTGRTVLDEVEIHDVTVRPAWRRRGVGTALVRSFLEDARSRGARRAVLEVAVSNENARALYAAIGFETCGRRSGYYRAGREDAEIMERMLL